MNGWNNEEPSQKGTGSNHPAHTDPRTLAGWSTAYDEDRAPNTDYSSQAGPRQEYYPNNEYHPPFGPDGYKYSKGEKAWTGRHEDFKALDTFYRMRHRIHPYDTSR